VRVHTADVLGSGGHVRAQVSDWEGGTRIKTMAFRAAGTPLGDILLKKSHMPVYLLGQIKLNRWQGRESAEFHIRDAAITVNTAEKLI
jgi:single-stranded-DNA-specific exonuclease